ncbi:hypothetical protein M0804_007589 [Polistes exclamans]|nr:hypothetical protein M0804_007589 [Polistes exclamans]
MFVVMEDGTGGGGDGGDGGDGGSGGLLYITYIHLPVLTLLDREEGMIEENYAFVRIATTPQRQRQQQQQQQQLQQRKIQLNATRTTTAFHESLLLPLLVMVVGLWGSKKKCNEERMRLRIAELLVWRETVCVSGSGDFASECLGHFQSKPKLVD